MFSLLLFALTWCYIDISMWYKILLVVKVVVDVVDVNVTAVADIIVVVDVVAAIKNIHET